MLKAGRVHVNLRVLVVQLNSQIGQIQQTTTRAWKMLEQFKTSLDSLPNACKPDLVVFPEFALTGYNFKSRDHILPYVTDDPSKGPSFELAAKVSKMFQCHTVIGYPERQIMGEVEKLYNSAIVVNPDQKVVKNYRKAFLYETDEQWGCQENPNGFETFPLTFPAKGVDVSTGKKVDVTLKTSIGICMDLSPYKFEAPFNEFEFATHNVDAGTNLIICPLAWLHSSSYTKHCGKSKTEAIDDIKNSLLNQNLPDVGSQGNYQIDLNQNNKTVPISRNSQNINSEYTELDKPDYSNLNYWLLRFLPFLHLTERSSWYEEGILTDIIKSRKGVSYIGANTTKPWVFSGKNALLVVANRCGVEDGTTVFGGTSGFYKFNGQEINESDDSKLDSTNESVELFGNLGKGLEGVIMRDVSFEIEGQQ